MNIITRENLEQLESDKIFYEENYQSVRRFIIKKGDKDKKLSDGDLKLCRFCGNREGEINKFKRSTTFISDAHAIPESLGNNSLLSNYECDECNGFFGKNIENDLGKWIKPIRTLSLIRGKKGIPSLTHGTNGFWKIISHNGGLVVKLKGEINPFSIDKEKKVVTFQVKIEPYRPISILKSFYKIFLSLIPMEYLEYFTDILGGIGCNNDSSYIANSTVIHEFTPGPMPHDILDVEILLRKSKMNIPYAFLIVKMANDAFQILIPDNLVSSIMNNIPPYPINREVNFSQFGAQTIEILDFSSENIVSNEMFIRNFSFSEKINLAKDDFLYFDQKLFE